MELDSLGVTRFFRSVWMYKPGKEMAQFNLMSLIGQPVRPCLFARQSCGRKKEYCRFM
ncbi:MAG: hypothetical protein WCP19_15895 [Chloroflexota bacterium]